MFRASLNRLRRWIKPDKQRQSHAIIIRAPEKNPPIISRRLYVTPGPDYNAPIGVLRARKEIREQILKQDWRRGNDVAAHRNMIAITELDRIIKSREAEYDKLSQDHRANHTI